MKLAYKRTCFVIALLLSLHFSAYATEGDPFVKTIQKEFPIPANGTTYIANKYGKVDIKTWDKNRVKVTVNIVVKTASSAAAKEVFDRIQIQFSNGDNYVKATTSIESNSEGWKSWFGSNKTDYAINYEVFLPETNNLDISHRYGDVYAAAVSGKVRLDVKYANFRSEGMGEQSSLSLGYGNGTIVKARNLAAEVSYSKLTIQEAQHLNLTTKYTEVRVTKAHDLHVTSRYDTYILGHIQDLTNTGSYDNFRITSAASLTMTTSYTDIKADKVANSLALVTNYSNAEVKLGEAFRSVSCTGGYSDFKIGIPASASYAIEGHASYAGLQYPEQADVSYEVKKNNAHTLKAKFGQSGNAKVSLDIKYGGAKIYAY